MKIVLETIYKRFAVINKSVYEYLDKLSYIIQNEFDKKEVDFLVKCVELDLDLETIELELRNKNKNNILSFTLLRLSALAESIPENQLLYVNKKCLNNVEIFLYLIKTIISFLLHKIKARVIYKNLIKEYPNV